MCFHQQQTRACMPCWLENCSKIAFYFIMLFHNVRGKWHGSREWTFPLMTHNSFCLSTASSSQTKLYQKPKSGWDPSLVVGNESLQLRQRLEWEVMSTQEIKSTFICSYIKICLRKDGLCGQYFPEMVPIIYRQKLRWPQLVWKSGLPQLVSVFTNITCKPLFVTVENRWWWLGGKKCYVAENMLYSMLLFCSLFLL